jgi:hypothetical protein
MVHQVHLLKLKTLFEQQRKTVARRNSYMPWPKLKLGPCQTWPNSLFTFRYIHGKPNQGLTSTLAFV